MKAETYPFVVRPLPYEYDALVPVLDAETLTFHHDKHYKTYVDNLNNALADYPELQKQSLPELLSGLDTLPGAIRIAVRNNGGGVFNHELYFDSMKSPVGQEPSGALAEAIDRDFGSYRQWKEQMKQSAVSKFGSGWAWLVSDKNGVLSIVQTANQDVPDLEEYTPVLLVDVWEHAYYLQYQNRRADYVEGWFGLINWRKAGKRYEDSLNGNA
ncbi:superoxide dismutase [Acetatifactor muris]|jgi:Fe-Mn family superoxide dismutase|uniref:Superoxide dismutase n=1 Tax=Acetatifactor muris TaxID=879566 RepID=A0A2K4ZDC5_9FIRM|nr:superoxide dismutase [Acetatifactor muris]MCI8799383.1 superoxide dismutase [Lachnospiraceae bacterium]MCR2046942.1 superoxide dismutase [Acetatifactor muris]SOY28469.1 Superoxide dismutase [Mn] 1 precursor [Acetatifactor muris]